MNFQIKELPFYIRDKNSIKIQELELGFLTKNSIVKDKRTKSKT
jgi:hypothetical protein